MKQVLAVVSGVMLSFGLGLAGVNPFGAAFIGISVVPFLASLDLIINPFFRK